MKIFVSLRFQFEKQCGRKAGVVIFYRLIIMEINNIGNNAGVIWNALNANGTMTETKLKKESGLASAEFYAALGWLAREGKLNVVVETRCGKDCEYYTL